MSVSHAGVEALRLAVGDARRQVAIAHHHRARRRATARCAAGTRSGWRCRAAAACRARSRARPAARGRSRRRWRWCSRETSGTRRWCPAARNAVEQPLGLRLLAALIEAFEGDQVSCRLELAACSHSVSSASRSSSVWRRRITRHCVAVDQHFGRQRPAQVGGAHRRRRRRRRRGPPAGRRPRPAAAARSRAKASVLSQIGPTMSTAIGVAGAAARPARCGGTRRRAPAASARSCRRRARRTACAPGNCLTSTTRVSSTPAGPTSTRPGSIATFRPLPRGRGDERAHVVGRDRAPAPPS